MRILLSMILMSGLSACAGPLGEISDASSLPPAASDEELDRVRAAYAMCVLDNALRLDDGSQRPITVALKIMPLCETQFAAWETVATAGGNRFHRYTIRDKIERGKDDYVTSVVLYERRERNFGQ